MPRTVGVAMYLPASRGAYDPDAYRRNRGDRRRRARAEAADPVGGRPPAAPPVLGPGGRPALAVAVRRERVGPDQGPVVRARRLAVPPRDVQPAAVRARPRRRQGHPAGGQAVPAAGTDLG